MFDPISFIHDLRWHDVPPDAQERLHMCLLDLLGIAAGGRALPMSGIVRDHAALDFPGTVPILFDGRGAALAAASMAGAMSIDALDGHDGYNPSKGHIGCTLLPALLALSHGRDVTGQEFMAALAMGYEVGSRVAEAQHATCPDYHTSGSWGAVTVAAAGARLCGLTPEQTAHALGIAEYHGPRSQMMRVIDHPTMLKDGAWGAMAGISAVQLAVRGMTGAPAVTVGAPPEVWQDLGQDWKILRQYFKPYPVCRWAHAPVEAVLELRAAHDLHSDQVTRIEVETFHESIRLASSEPQTTEEAQYSTSFPCAVAMARGALGPADLHGAALYDPEVLRLSRSLVMRESAEANALFPGKRIARVRLVLTDGRVLDSVWKTPKWDWQAPPSPSEIRVKYDALALPVLGAARSAALAQAVEQVAKHPLQALTDLVYPAVEGG
jgi:2-methylcitrate dehydratase PrpD